jgi:small subunit ribosomal protein S18
MKRMQGKFKRPKRKAIVRLRSNILKDVKIEYKNVDLLQKLVTAHGKIMSRRFTGATTKQQRDLTRAIKQAQFLALLPVGSTKRF